jgi:hypothetical protein
VALRKPPLGPKTSKPIRNSIQADRTVYTSKYTLTMISIAKLAYLLEKSVSLDPAMILSIGREFWGDWT